jgi:hypothetical protein
MIRPVWVFVWVMALFVKALLQIISAASRGAEKILWVIISEGLRPANDYVDKLTQGLGEAIE